MVPADRILAAAVEEQAVDRRPVGPDHAVARRDGARRRARCSGAGSRVPLLIGGATTSRQHTAVKIAPEYGGPVVYVPDASRVIDVVSSLLSDDAAARVRGGEPGGAGRRCATGTSARGARPLRPYAEARAQPPADRLGARGRRRRRRSPAAASSADVSLGKLAEFIDWTFFFSAWGLKGRFPAILDHAEYGPAARELYDHARRLLRTLVEEGSLRARGVYGFWPAGSDGDDIVLFDGPGAARRGRAVPDAAPAGDRRRGPAAAVAGRLRGAGRRRRHATTSARSPSPPASAPTNWPPATRARTTTTTRSW